VLDPGQGFFQGARAQQQAQRVFDGVGAASPRPGGDPWRPQAGARPHNSNRHPEARPLQAPPQPPPLGRTLRQPLRRMDGVERNAGRALLDQPAQQRLHKAHLPAVGGARLAIIEQPLQGLPIPPRRHHPRQQPGQRMLRALFQFVREALHPGHGRDPTPESPGGG
jgi:hypothetical protein